MVKEFAFRFLTACGGLKLIARRLPPALAFGLLTLAFSISASGHTITQQQPTTDESAHGIELQQQGKTEEAVVALRAAVKRDKRDLRAWHFLGLALEQKGDLKEARKAHEKAANLGDQLVSDLLGSSGTGEEVSNRFRAGGQSLSEAGESAQKCLQIEPQFSGRKLRERQLQADSLLAFAEIAKSPPGTLVIATSKEVSVKARVLSKPEPQYTDEARAHLVVGTVILRAIFAANGRVVGIHVVSGLPDGLTERAIDAARRIKFVPAIKDGRPVSVFIQLEYNFNFY